MSPSEDVRRQELGHEEQEIRKLFHEAHRDEAVPPPFEALWNRVRAEATTWHRPPGPRLALTGALVVLVLALVVVWALREPGSPPSTPTSGPLVAEASWDRSWAGWEGPLDFLLETPGRTYLDSVPTIPDDEPLSSESVLEMERSATDVL